MGKTMLPADSDIASAGPFALDESTAACVHHWVLAEPAGDVVLGRCRRCEMTRAFPATPEGSGRFDDYRELATDNGYDGRERAATTHMVADGDDDG